MHISLKGCLCCAFGSTLVCYVASAMLLILEMNVEPSVLLCTSFSSEMCVSYILASTSIGV